LNKVGRSLTIGALTLELMRQLLNQSSNSRKPSGS